MFDSDYTEAEDVAFEYEALEELFGYEGPEFLERIKGTDCRLEHVDMEECTMLYFRAKKPYEQDLFNAGENMLTSRRERAGIRIPVYFQQMA